MQSYELLNAEGGRKQKERQEVQEGHDLPLLQERRRGTMEFKWPLEPENNP